MKPTEIIAVMDESGSTSGIGGELASGMNAFLQSQLATPGEVRLTYIRFDNYVNLDYSSVDIRVSCPRITHSAHGMTALNDAMGMALEQEYRRVKHTNPGAQVIFLILTDGEENNSRKYSIAQVRGLMERAQEEGASVVFMAANIDAFSTGARYGIRDEYTHQFDATKQGAEETMRYATCSVTSLRNITC